ncbi:hypothetical protein BH09PSE1_BH09PSE1_01570 [soil metagenome]
MHQFVLPVVALCVAATMALSAKAQEKPGQTKPSQDDAAATRNLNEDFLARDSSIAANNADIVASNTAEATAYKTAMAAYQADLVRLAQEAAAAQAAHEAEVANVQAQNDRARHAWEACVAGDRSQCRS